MKKAPAAGAVGTLTRAPYWGNTCTWAADLDTSRTSAARADAETPNAVDAGQPPRDDESHAADAAGARRRAMVSVDGESAALAAEKVQKVRASSAKHMPALDGPP